MNPIEQYRPDEWALCLPLHGSRMLELGGKWCSQARVTYKEVFEALGYEHVSVDWNGEHGALIRDLREPLDLGQFDMVTNFGTSEHVTGEGGQAGLWANVHNACRVGGVYAGQCPYPDGKNWFWHGEHYPTEAFYQAFAELNGWKVERLYRGGKPPHENLYCRMVKTDDREFTMPDASLIYRNQVRPR